MGGLVQIVSRNGIRYGYVQSVVDFDPSGRILLSLDAKILSRTRGTNDNALRHSNSRTRHKWFEGQQDASLVSLSEVATGNYSCMGK
jgi:hypothetical protein